MSGKTPPERPATGYSVLPSTSSFTRPSQRYSFTEHNEPPLFVSDVGKLEASGHPDHGGKGRHWPLALTVEALAVYVGTESRHAADSEAFIRLGVSAARTAFGSQVAHKLSALDTNHFSREERKSPTGATTRKWAQREVMADVNHVLRSLCLPAEKRGEERALPRGWTRVPPPEKDERRNATLMAACRSESRPEAGLHTHATATSWPLLRRRVPGRLIANKPFVSTRSPPDRPLSQLLPATPYCY